MNKKSYFKLDHEVDNFDPSTDPNSGPLCITPSFRKPIGLPRFIAEFKRGNPFSKGNKSPYNYGSLEVSCLDESYKFCNNSELMEQAAECCNNSELMDEATEIIDIVETIETRSKCDTFETIPTEMEFQNFDTCDVGIETELVEKSKEKPKRCWKRRNLKKKIAEVLVTSNDVYSDSNEEAVCINIADDRSNVSNTTMIHESDEDEDEDDELLGSIQYLKPFEVCDRLSSVASLNRNFSANVQDPDGAERSVSSVDVNAVALLASENYQTTPEHDLNTSAILPNIPDTGLREATPGMASSMYYKTCHFAKMGEYLRESNTGENFYDVKIEVLPKVFYAHRVALACHSEYFAKFFAEKAEGRRKYPMEIQIQGITAEAFEIFLKYVYDGEANPPPETIPDVVIAAEKFRIPALLKACYLHGQNLSLESALLILLRVASGGAFYDTAYNIILNKFPGSLASANFPMLDVGTMIKILSDDNLNTPSEVLVFNAVLRWIQGAAACRSEYVHQLMSCVRFSLMSPLEIMQCCQSYVFQEYNINRSRLLKDNWIITARELKIADPFAFDKDKPRKLFESYPGYNPEAVQANVMMFQPMGILPDGSAALGQQSYLSQTQDQRRYQPGTPSGFIESLPPGSSVVRLQTHKQEAHPGGADICSDETTIKYERYVEHDGKAVIFEKRTNTDHTEHSVDKFGRPIDVVDRRVLNHTNSNKGGKQIPGHVCAVPSDLTRNSIAEKNNAAEVRNQSDAAIKTNAIVNQKLQDQTRNNAEIPSNANCANEFRNLHSQSAPQGFKFPSYRVANAAEDRVAKAEQSRIIREQNRAEKYTPRVEKPIAKRVDHGREVVENRETFQRQQTPAHFEGYQGVSQNDPTHDRKMQSQHGFQPVNGFVRDLELKAADRKPDLSKYSSHTSSIRPITQNVKSDTRPVSPLNRFANAARSLMVPVQNTSSVVQMPGVNYSVDTISSNDKVPNIMLSPPKANTPSAAGMADVVYATMKRALGGNYRPGRIVPSDVESEPPTDSSGCNSSAVEDSDVSTLIDEITTVYDNHNLIAIRNAALKDQRGGIRVMRTPPRALTPYKSMPVNAFNKMHADTDDGSNNSSSDTYSSSIPSATQFPFAKYQNLSFGQQFYQLPNNQFNFNSSSNQGKGDKSSCKVDESLSSCTSGVKYEDLIFPPSQNGFLQSGHVDNAFEFNQQIGSLASNNSALPSESTDFNFNRSGGANLVSEQWTDQELLEQYKSDPANAFSEQDIPKSPVIRSRFTTVDAESETSGDTSNVQPIQLSGMNGDELNITNSHITETNHTLTDETQPNYQKNFVVSASGDPIQTAEYKNAVLLENEQPYEIGDKSQNGKHDYRSSARGKEPAPKTESGGLFYAPVHDQSVVQREEAMRIKTGVKRMAPYYNYPVRQSGATSSSKTAERSKLEPENNPYHLPVRQPNLPPSFQGHQSERQQLDWRPVNQVNNQFTAVQQPNLLPSFQGQQIDREQLDWGTVNQVNNQFTPAQQPNYAMLANYMYGQPKNDSLHGKADRRRVKISIHEGAQTSAAFPVPGEMCAKSTSYDFAPPAGMSEYVTPMGTPMPTAMTQNQPPFHAPMYNPYMNYPSTSNWPPQPAQQLSEQQMQQQPNAFIHPSQMQNFPMFGFPSMAGPFMQPPVNPAMLAKVDENQAAATQTAHDLSLRQESFVPENVPPTGGEKTTDTTRTVQIADSVIEHVISQNDPVASDVHKATTSFVSNWRPTPSDETGDMLVIGGHSTTRHGFSHETSIYRYSHTSEEWAPFVKLPEPRLHHSAAKLGNCLYLVGGCGLTENSTPQPTTFSFSNLTKKWLSKCNMNERRMYHRVCALFGMLYAIAGQDEAGRVLNSIECYNPNNDSWTLLQAMKTSRLYPAVSAARGRLFVAGGYGVVTNKKYGRPVLKSVESYNPMTNEWQACAEMPIPRYHATMLDVQDRLFVIGGANKASQENIYELQSLASIDMYEPQTDTWSYVTSMITPRHAAGSALMGTQIYIVGGINCPANREVQSIEIYDAASGKWASEILDLPFACRSFDCVIIPGETKNDE